MATTQIERDATQLSAVRDASLSIDLTSLSAADLAASTAMHAETMRHMEAQQVAYAAEIARRSGGPAEESFAKRLGYRSPKAMLAETYGMRARSASSLVAVATATSESRSLTGAPIDAPFPHLRDAIREGLVSLQQADAVVVSLADAGKRALPEDLAWAERTLVSAATDEHAPLRPELIAVQGSTFSAVIDPDGVLPDDERKKAMRSLKLGRRADGMWSMALLCTPEQGATLKAVLDAHLSPKTGVRFADPEAGRDAIDDRSREQLQADVLVGIVGLHARSGDAPQIGGEAPTLVLTGTYAALSASLTGETIDPAERMLTIATTGDVVPVERAARMLCDSNVQVAITDDDGHVLNLGRSQRLFSAAQRRALMLEQTTCIRDGCDMPAALSEVHHVVFWSNGGLTDLDHGAILCDHHHDQVHAGLLRVVPSPPGSASRWRVIGVDERPPRVTLEPLAPVSQMPEPARRNRDLAARGYEVLHFSDWVEATRIITESGLDGLFENGRAA